MFKEAIAGIVYAIRNERTIRIQILIGICTLALASAVLNTTEFAIICILASNVISYEIMNTTIERLCDAIDEDFNYKVKIIKDLSAGFVLTTVITSVIVGILIFMTARAQT